MIPPDLSPPDFIPFYKGRVALHAILRLARIGPGDEVLLPGYTCVVVPNAIQYCGATPVYGDIESENYGIDADALYASEGTHWHAERAKAIIVQHTYGIPADMRRLRRLAEDFGLLLIEDSCHALGSTHDGAHVGSLGDAAFFSSQWSKPISTGLGGWARLNNATLIDRLPEALPDYTYPSRWEDWLLSLQYHLFRLLHRPTLFWLMRNTYRRLTDMGLMIGSSTGEELAGELPPDFARRMGPLQEDRLRRALLTSLALIAHRRTLVTHLESRLSELDVPLVPIRPQDSVDFLRYPVRVENKAALLASAEKQRLELGDWFISPTHPIQDSPERVNYLWGQCPQAERACSEVVNIPLHDRISKNEVDRVAHFLSREAEIVTQQATPSSR